MTAQKNDQTHARVVPDTSSGAGESTLFPADTAVHLPEFTGAQLKQFGVQPLRDRTFVWSYVCGKVEDNLKGFISINEKQEIGVVLHNYQSVGTVVQLPTSLAQVGLSDAHATLVQKGPPSPGISNEQFALYSVDSQSAKGAPESGVHLVPLRTVHEFLRAQVAAGAFVDLNVYAALHHIAHRHLDQNECRPQLPIADCESLKGVAERCKGAAVLKEGFVFQILDVAGQECARRKRGACAAIVLTVTPDNNVILVEQVRPPLQGEHCSGITIECPAGLVGDASELIGEEPTVAGIREVIEEAGYKPKKMEVLLVTPSIPSLTNEMLVFMVASGAELVGDGGGVREEGENIRRHVIPLDVVDSFLKQQEELGKLVDPKVYAALELYRCYLVKDKPRSLASEQVPAITTAALTHYVVEVHRTCERARLAITAEADERILAHLKTEGMLELYRTRASSQEATGLADLLRVQGFLRSARAVEGARDQRLADPSIRMIDQLVTRGIGFRTVWNQVLTDLKGEDLSTVRFVEGGWGESLKECITSAIHYRDRLGVAMITVFNDTAIVINSRPNSSVLGIGTSEATDEASRVLERTRTRLSEIADARKVVSAEIIVRLTEAGYGALADSHSGLAKVALEVEDGELRPKLHIFPFGQYTSGETASRMCREVGTVVVFRIDVDTVGYVLPSSSGITEVKISSQVR